MDPRILISVVLGIGYSLWVAGSALKDPSVDAPVFQRYARNLLLAGCAFLIFVVALGADYSPISDILVGKNQDYRTVGGVALGYSLSAASGIFWLASRVARDRA
jgi:hypothetical protein